MGVAQLAPEIQLQTTTCKRPAEDDETSSLGTHILEYPVTRPIPAPEGYARQDTWLGKRGGVGCHSGNQQNRYYIHGLHRWTRRPTGDTAHNGWESRVRTRRRYLTRRHVPHGWNKQDEKMASRPDRLTFNVRFLTSAKPGYFLVSLLLLLLLSSHDLRC